MAEPHGTGRVVTHDSAGNGQWTESRARINNVAIIPHGRGQYEVYLALPYHVSNAENWQEILWEAEARLGYDDCCSTPDRAWEFYTKVFEDLTTYGY